MARKSRSKKANTEQPSSKSAGASAKGAILAVVGLCIVHYVLAVTSVLNKSNTYDEIAHLTRGYSYLLTGDFRLEPPHPPLAHVWAAIPGLGNDVKFPQSWMQHASWYTSDVWQVGRAFFYYAKSGNDAIIDSLLWRGRAMIALLSVALGLLVYSASSKLFGQVGGLISLTLYAFSPTMLAHGRLVTTDCIAALFFAACLLSIWWMLHRVTIASVLVSALCLAGLFLSKMSAVLIIPVGLVMLTVRLISRQPLEIKLGNVRRQFSGVAGQLGCFGAVLVVWVLVVWACIWAAYGFRYDSMRGAEAGRDRYFCPNAIPEGQDVWQWQLRSLDHLEPTVTFLREHRLFPEAYIYSAVMSAQTARGRMAFMNGSIDLFGHRWFFPWAFLIKTPLPLFALLLVLLLYAIFSKGGADERPGWKSWLYRTTPLWAFFAIYWIASMRTHLNIGHRHILPIYPILFVVCGAAAFVIRSHMRSVRVGVYALVGLFIACSLWTFPNYLTYFNSIVGGPQNGYKYLVDSSLDWGQDLPGVKHFIDHRKNSQNTAPVYLSYFGSGGSKAIDHFKIDAIQLPEAMTDKSQRIESYGPGTYLISATTLQQVYQTYRGESLHDWTAELEQRYQSQTSDSSDPGSANGTYRSLAFARFCSYLRTREPDAWINNSVLVYEIPEAVTWAPFGDERD
ncbi:MAG TPA: glycosyltransferase family 39 protein [Phycisphaerae bacterium]|nr:glycosyltransferase family 39 protein [Phycisphaerae bacterium]